ncbi:hypothetical protein SECTIM467_176 [Brevibacillus phage SecTim467]|uniref:Uncharacterized protein n=2 Tax=Jenstvirus jenst TaxID=1982225 RepID=A0A0K2CNU4_9CAUD|nr:hypothetical protein AVV11_gp020 [Brevibacillus phage Jenst]ALA07300.1 hypothetical protein JENST_171 [Brevibacillus phage Jenst]ALA07497.1 hypothetical protein SECTIM467_176 [Brevibacillus phage SecTim467]
MSLSYVIRSGEYLGFCEKKGYVYSVFRGYSPAGAKRFAVVSLLGGQVDTLMVFEGAANCTA